MKQAALYKRRNLNSAARTISAVLGRDDRHLIHGVFILLEVKRFIKRATKGKMGVIFLLLQLYNYEVASGFPSVPPIVKRYVLVRKKVRCTSDNRNLSQLLLSLHAYVRKSKSSNARVQNPPVGNPKPP